MVHEHEYAMCVMCECLYVSVRVCNCEIVVMDLFEWHEHFARVHHISLTFNDRRTAYAGCTGTDCV